MRIGENCLGELRPAPGSNLSSMNGKPSGPKSGPELQVFIITYRYVLNKRKTFHHKSASCFSPIV